LRNRKVPVVVLINPGLPNRGGIEGTTLLHQPLDRDENLSFGPILYRLDLFKLPITKNELPPLNEGVSRLGKNKLEGRVFVSFFHGLPVLLYSFTQLPLHRNLRREN